MRRTRTLWIAAALIASSVLTAASVTYAQQPPAPQPGAQGHRMLGRLQRYLGLTDDQVTNIQAIFQQQRDARRQLGQSMRQAQTELRQLALNGADANAIAAKKAQIAQLASQGLDLRVQTLQQIGPLLTQDQRDKLAQHGPAAMWRGRRQHKPQQQG
jgi:Spy/CpxP family protein refolding chaperone